MSPGRFQRTWAIEMPPKPGRQDARFIWSRSNERLTRRLAIVTVSMLIRLVKICSRMKTNKTPRAAKRKTAIVPAQKVEISTQPAPASAPASAPAPAPAPVLAPKPSPAKLPPSLEAIRARAYQLFQQSGSRHGRDQEHWFQAERELSA